MAISLHHHPFTRATTAHWMLEEVGVDYALHYVDLKAGAHKAPEFLAVNPMGKVPTLIDGEVVITESAAIGLYLADRYAPGVLSPALDDPARAAYLRWSLFGSAVVEPAAYARQADWDYSASSAGWGTFEEMNTTLDHAIGDGPFLLGDRFTMADVILGATVRFLLMFGMLDKRPVLEGYVERLQARPAWRRSSVANAAIIAERGLATR